MFTYYIRARIDQKNKQGKHSIVLIVTKDGKTKSTSIKQYVLPIEWNFKTHQPTAKHSNKVKLQNYINLLLSKAGEIDLDYQQKGKNPTLEQFSNKVMGKGGENLFKFIDSIINDLEEEGRKGYAIKFKNLKSTLEKFTSETPIRSVDYSFLVKYEKSLRANGSGDGGVNVNMRTLRAVFNKAIDFDYAEHNDYPFRRYKIVTPHVIKRAKKVSEISKFLNYDYPEKFDKTMDIIRFSILNQCINFVDIAYLTKDNVVDGRLEYFRKKNTKHPTFLSINLLPESLEILKKYDYYFGVGEKDQWKDYKKGAGILSKNIIKMRNLSETDFTFYTFRHSYSTIARNDLGISKDVIAQLLSHKGRSITDTYLSDYDDKVIDEANKKICEYLFGE